MGAARFGGANFRKRVCPMIWVDLRPHGKVAYHALPDYCDSPYCHARVLRFLPAGDFQVKACHAEVLLHAEPALHAENDEQHFEKNHRYDCLARSFFRESLNGISLVAANCARQSEL